MAKKLNAAAFRNLLSSYSQQAISELGNNVEESSKILGFAAQRRGDNYGATFPENVLVGPICSVIVAHTPQWNGVLAGICRSASRQPRGHQLG
jgi:hypothetical protein